jgi:rare lipoprotein A
MLGFGPPPPNASPSIPVTVEALSPAEGVDVTATPTAAAGSVGAQLPNSGSQTASNVVALSTSNSLPATSSPTTAPPPYGGMTAVVAANAPTWTGNATAPASTRGQPTANAATSPVIDVKTLPVRDKVDQVAILGKPQIFIQAGAFREFVNANRLRARLTGLGQPVMVSQVYVTNQPFFRVRLGPLRSVEDADTALARLVALGYPEAQIVVD